MSSTMFGYRNCISEMDITKNNEIHLMMPPPHLTS